MQTILGSGGAIGTTLARELSNYTRDIKLVSRRPVPVNSTDRLHPADLSDPLAVDKAIAGSDVCYLTVGLDYKTKVWQQTWPPLIKSVVESCIRNKCRLVFFDNMYALGKESLGRMTEESPANPCSKKGEVRARVDYYLLEQVEKGNLEALIARAPDFFGPVKKQNSLLMNMVYDNMVKGKTAQWFCNADVVHSMGYTLDLAKGTAMLGNTEDAYNQIWNLPVDEKALTGREWVNLFASVMKGSDKVSVLPKWSAKALGLFIPVLGEMHEMLYQFDRPYYFDSGKFCRRFNYVPTTNREAVKQTISQLKPSLSRLPADELRME